MIRSMTGFGRGERRTDATLVVVDARSVNHRFLDLKLKVPGEAAALEADLRSVVARRVGRGRLDLTISLQRESSQTRVQIDLPLLQRYVDAAGRIRRETGVEGEVALRDLLQVPGAIRVEGARAELGRAEAAAVMGAAHDALDRLCRAREREGEALRRDLVRRVKAIQRRAAAIGKRAGGATARAASRLRERVLRLAEGVDVDPSRLAQEVAFLADRSDVSEERVRLEAHLEATLRLLAADGGPVGKELDFLTQEIQRETNTIQSKAADLLINRAALAIKSEVEKIREQVQNIE